MFLSSGHLISQEQAYLAWLIWDEDRAIYEEIFESADLGVLRYHKSDMLWSLQQGWIEWTSEAQDALAAEVDALDRQIKQ